MGEVGDGVLLLSVLSATVHLYLMVGECLVVQMAGHFVCCWVNGIFLGEVSLHKLILFANPDTGVA